MGRDDVRASDGTRRVGVRVRLAADFLGSVEPLPCKEEQLFTSRAFRRYATRFLTAYILDRDPLDTDETFDLASSHSYDLLRIAIELIASDEFFVEQAGENGHFFLARLARMLPFLGSVASPPHEQDLSDVSGRTDYLARVFGAPGARRWLAAAVYNALGLGQPSKGATDRALRAKSGLLEELFRAAATERRYIIESRRGQTTLDVCRSRLLGSLLRVFRHTSSSMRAELGVVAYEAVFAARPSLTFDRILTLMRRELDLQQLKTLLTRRCHIEKPTVETRLRLRRMAVGTDDLAPDLEKDARRSCFPEAERIATDWIKTFATRPISNDLRAVERWTERLLENDALLETFVWFLLSEDCIGLDIHDLRSVSRISAPPGSNLGRGSRGADLDRIVATSFFYWYDDIDGKAVIACPDSMANEYGADSLSVAPASRTNFTYQSSEWHRRELADMARAAINVVLPVSYVHPFSSAPLLSSVPVKEQRLRFANAGLRSFRDAWMDLVDAGQACPLVGLFYDTSTLNRDNRFGLKVDFRRRYAKEWFYESIRDFFSYLPQQMWARFKDAPIVFVYHPCFGDFLDDSLYEHVRARFRTDFGSEVYIVTAAEEEAPRVLQAARLKADADALAERTGLDVLIDILCRDELYQSTRRNDEVFARMIARRAFGPRLSVDEAMHRFFEGGLESPVRRKSFVERILHSPDFRWAVLDSWFERLLRRAIDMRDPSHAALVDVTMQDLANGDWLEALSTLAASQAFLETAGSTDNHFADWLYQSIVLKHPNDLCTPGYGSIHADESGKRELLALLSSIGRRDAIRVFLQRYEAREAIISLWHYKYYGWYNPGIADSSFYWSAAISPIIRGVASIGPGYDQHKLRHRPELYMPRRDGKTYEERWQWILAMQPRPKIVHIETWNEFFEGTAICATQEHGDQYIELTKRCAARFFE